MGKPATHINSVCCWLTFDIKLFFFLLCSTAFCLSLVRGELSQCWLAMLPCSAKKANKDWFLSLTLLFFLVYLLLSLLSSSKHLLSLITLALSDFLWFSLTFFYSYIVWHQSCIFLCFFQRIVLLSSGSSVHSARKDSNTYRSASLSFLSLSVVWISRFFIHYAHAQIEYAREKLEERSSQTTEIEIFFFCEDKKK